MPSFSGLVSARKAHLVGHTPLIMQVTCSNCGARYAVDPTAIGPTGRTVQCVRCNHRWFQELEAPSVSASPAETPPAAAPDTVPDFVIRPSTPGAGLPALTTPPQRKRNWGTWIAFAIVFTVLFGGAGYAYRAEIKARLPDSWRTLFHPKGAAAAPARPQVGIDMGATKIDLVDGRYVVQGELVNTGTAPGSTSRLKLVFRAGNEVLAERAMPLIEGPIAPGARMSFKLPLDEPPAGATNIIPTVD
jgi:predicted Zn finger-like uncharacterized protein